MIYDLAVIGGGINGVAVARDAALRGLNVCLFEKSDFGSGASTKTSKLAHGGLRYLEGLEIGLVHESLKERSLLLKNASHLVKPLTFIFPVYAEDHRPLWQVNMGLYLYDLLAAKGGLPCHRKIAIGIIKENFPLLRDGTLRGGCLYYDAQMKDNRLLIETVVDAERAGASVFNYTSVVRLLKTENMQISGIAVKDLHTGEERQIRTKVVVNATGAWANEALGVESRAIIGEVVPTKGVHIVIPQICPHTALLLHAPQDGRVFFVLPWEGQSLVGTTDTFYEGSLDHVEVDVCDVNYLLTAMRHHFPKLDLSPLSVQSAFAGLRPLVDGAVHGRPSDISRRHVIKRSESGLITVIGGKYTTHRKIAEEVVDSVVKVLGPQPKLFPPCCTASTPLPGIQSEAAREQLLQALLNAGLTAKQAGHLQENYGKNGWQILEIIRRYPDEKKQICPLHPHIFAELAYSIEVEHVRTPEDWFYRRTSIAYTSACKGQRCYDYVARRI